MFPSEKLSRAMEAWSQMARCPQLKQLLNDLRTDESALRLQALLDEHRQVFGQMRSCGIDLTPPTLVEPPILTFEDFGFAEPEDERTIVRPEVKSKIGF